MPEPTLEKMDQLIHKLVRAKMDDGQLNESPLTLKDLENICKAFLTVLTGVFHQRVEYPKVEIPKKNSHSAEDKAEAEKTIENAAVPEQEKESAAPAAEPAEQAGQNTEEKHGA